MHLEPKFEPGDTVWMLVNTPKKLTKYPMCPSCDNTRTIKTGSKEIACHKCSPIQYTSKRVCEYTVFAVRLYITKNETVTWCRLDQITSTEFPIDLLYGTLIEAEAICERENMDGRLKAINQCKQREEVYSVEYNGDYFND